MIDRQGLLTKHKNVLEVVAVVMAWTDAPPNVEPLEYWERLDEDARECRREDAINFLMRVGERLVRAYSVDEVAPGSAMGRLVGFGAGGRQREVLVFRDFDTEEI